MKTSLFIPTNRPGGLDVLENSLCLQTEIPDVLIVCDDWSDRKELWEFIAESAYIDKVININHTPTDEFYPRYLARAYNDAAQISLEHGCELMISLQDYIHIPIDGIEKFKYAYSKLGNDYLYTGLTSIANTPGVETVTRPLNNYSVFDKPYRSILQPTDIKWYDVRYEMYQEAFQKSDTIVTDDVNHWEANWAAFPTVLYERGLEWDETYDQGYAYENSDLARRAVRDYGCNIMIDKGNHAISLPHFDYWPSEKEDLVKYSNKDKYNAMS